VEGGNWGAQSVQCLATDLTAGVRSPTEAEEFSSNLCVQTGSGARPASYTMGTGGSYPGGKARPGPDADHSPPYSAEVKKEGAIPPVAQMRFYGAWRNHFTFLYLC
jgi:hypothetical protein